MSYSFSNTSKDRLETCHADLQLIAMEAIKSSEVDFGIACGHRSIEDQQKAFKAGLSKLDGVNKKSKHNHSPSMAFDIYAWVGSTSYNVHDLSYIAGVIQAVARRLKAEGKITHDIRWGGNWDQDGVIITDQTFQDLPHFELV